MHALCMSFVSPVIHNNTQKLAHISLSIIEFIVLTMSLNVSAHRAIIRRYIIKPYTIELRLPYVSIHYTYHCVLQ
jgi:hypothetical protein